MFTPLNTTNRLVACAAMVGVVVLWAGETEAQAPKWKFEKGKTLHYQWAEKNETKIDVGGAASASNVSQTMELVWTIDSVEGEKARITQSVREMSIVMNTAIGSFRYSTAETGNAPGDPLGAAFSKILDVLVESKTTFTLSAQGVVSDVSTDEKTVAALTGAANADVGESSTSADVLKQVILQTTIILPGESIEKGKTWTRTLDVPDPPFGKKNLEVSYASLGEDRASGAKVYKIEVKSKGKLIVDKKNAQVSNMVRNLRDVGTVLFDSVAGNVRSSKIVERSTETMNVQGNRIDQTVKKTWIVTRRD